MATELSLEPCLPPVWAATGHAQTILGHILPSPLLKGGVRFEVKLDDGDILAAHAALNCGLEYLGDIQHRSFGRSFGKRGRRRCE